MNKLDAYEAELLAAYEKGELRSTSLSKADLAKFKAAASVLHKYASDRLVEKPFSLTPRSSGRAEKRRSV
jgi:hypothetical protein